MLIMIPSISLSIKPQQYLQEEWMLLLNMDEDGIEQTSQISTEKLQTHSFVDSSSAEPFPRLQREQRVCKLSKSEDEPPLDRGTI